MTVAAGVVVGVTVGAGGGANCLVSLTILATDDVRKSRPGTASCFLGETKRVEEEEILTMNDTVPVFPAFTLSNVH